MAHEWYTGVLNTSSWHGLESVEQLPDADTLIRRGEETGAWPVSTTLEEMISSSGLKVPGYTCIAGYADGKRKAMSPVGDRYTPLDVAAWRETVKAAVLAGARPAGAFALCGGARLLATFEIPGGNDGSGLRNYMHIADSLDGSVAHIAGGSTIRVVCANTLSMAMREKTNARVKHTQTVNDKAVVLRQAIEQHVKSGEAIRELYKQARATKVDRRSIEDILDVLFPLADEEMAKEQPSKASRLLNNRADAIKSMGRTENNEGSTLATVWNAATWLVDRSVDGLAKQHGESDSLNSMLFGSRGRRVADIQTVIAQVVQAGSIRPMVTA